MSNDPVLQRSMFQKQTSIAPSVGLGIDSVTTPDQNAKALKNMFQPTVSLNMPTQMLQQEQQPVQSFQEGGMATPLMRSRYEDPERRMRIEALRRQAIDEADARRTGPEEPGVGTKIAASVLDLTTIPYQFGAGLVGAKPTSMTPFYDEYVRRARGETGTPLFNPFQKAGAATGDVLTAPIVAAQKIGSMIDPAEIPAPTGYTPRFDVLRKAEAETERKRGISGLDLSGTMGGGEVYSAEPGRSIMSQMRKEEPAPPPSAPPREKGALELTLDGIKEERARSAEDKKQNALLALMQAGFAMAAGRSPNALSNIGAGGQAGIAAFASLEKARREEQAALRRDEMSIRLAQAKLAEDPDTVKLFKALGGGDLAKGFDIYNADKKLQAAIETRKDFRASEDDLRAANEYIRSRLSSGMSGSNTGLPTVRLAPKQ